MTRKDVAEEEENSLIEYMKEISQEKWASDNKRLQKFIQHELLKPRKRNEKKQINTTNRLGFTNDGYSNVELAGTNEIQKGDFLQSLGQTSPVSNKRN